MRSSLLDEMGQDYLTTARAKGLRDDLVRRRHAVPNALLPTTTLIALSLGFVVGGAVTIETVFSIEGLGLLLIQAVNDIDRPLMQGIFLTLAVCVIVANLIANLLYGVLDPRVRTRGGG
jgi:peptide/nickel transport system permease protein